MKKLLQRLFSRLADEPKFRVVPANSPELSLQMWREQEAMVAEFATLSKLPIFMAMIQTLRNESPLHYVEEKPTADGKILRLGVIEGYQLALNNLEAMATMAKQATPLVATFETPKETEGDED